MDDIKILMRPCHVSALLAVFATGGSGKANLNRYSLRFTSNLAELTTAIFC